MAIGSVTFENVVAMERFSGEYSAFCVREFYKTNDLVVDCCRKLEDKFKGTGSAVEKFKSARPRSSGTDGNVERV